MHAGRLRSQGHLFSKRGRPLLFDPCTRTSFLLDAAGEAAAREMLDEGWQETRSYPTGVSRKELAAARKELSALRRRWFLRDAPVPEPDVEPRPMRLFRPIVSRRCNLRCRYCFTGHERRDVMSREVAEATARFVAGQIAACWPKGGVWFSLVGEPTVDLPLYEEFSRLLVKEGEHLGVPMTTSLVVSNLTTLDSPPMSDRLHDLVELGAISLDGPPAAHDAMRVYPDGWGTYADVRRGLERLRAIGGNPSAVATITAMYPDVSEVYFHLFELGFPAVVVKPVRARPDAAYAIGQNLPAICAGYDRFAERLLALSDDDLLKRLRVLVGGDGNDYLARFLVRVVLRDLLHWRCGAWRTDIAIDTDGKLYGCYALFGVEEACVGTVWDGIDEARVRQIVDCLHISKREPCSQCWARLLCGGGCPHQSWLTHGGFEPPDAAECELNRHLIELAIWFWAELKEKRPAIAVELQNAASSLRTELDGPLVIPPSQS